jgi:hypothetical protein
MIITYELLNYLLFLHAYFLIIESIQEYATVFESFGLLHTN